MASKEHLTFNTFSIQHSTYKNHIRKLKKLPPHTPGGRGVTTLKKVVRNAGQGCFAGGGAALFKGAPMPKCTVLKIQHSTGAT